MTRSSDRIEIALPSRCLVVLSGIPASGKSTFAQRHFGVTAIVSSDACRAAICDDPSDQAASRDAFDLMDKIIAARMKFDRLCVADATHLTHESRKRLVDLSRRFDYPAYLIAFDVPPDECKRRDAVRTDRRVGQDVIDKYAGEFVDDLERYRAEGFSEIWVLRDDAADRAEVSVGDRPADPSSSDTRAAEP